MKKILATLLLLNIFCAFRSEAQTLTATYIQYVDSADQYISRKKWDDAERVIIKALRHEPANKSNFLLWSNLGIVRENKGDYEGAVEAYTIGLATAPNSTVLLTNRARSNLSLGRTDDAYEDLDKALGLDEKLQWPLKMRGIILASKKEKGKALSDFAKYTELYGDDAAILETKGDIYVSDGKSGEALEAYRKAYGIEPDEALLGKLVMTAYSFGKIDDVEKDLEAGIKKYPRSAVLYLARALLNKSRYQTDAYESDLKTAERFGIDPELIRQLIKK